MAETLFLALYIYFWSSGRSFKTLSCLFLCLSSCYSFMFNIFLLIIGSNTAVNAPLNWLKFWITWCTFLIAVFKFASFNDLVFCTVLSSSCCHGSLYFWINSLHYFIVYKVANDSKLMISNLSISFRVCVNSASCFARTSWICFTSLRFCMAALALSRPDA